MNQAIIITLSGIVFYLEKDAHTSLQHYLDSLEAHYSHNQDREEILEDIERRFAESFSEMRHDVSHTITKTQVQQVIDELGDPTVDEDSESDTESEPGIHGVKRLYRDEQHGMIAGVAAGLGAYFSIDPILFRLVFVVFALFGGTGLLVYLILWIITPEAKTFRQKRAMKGEPITLSGIAEKFSSEEVKTKARSTLNQVANGLHELWRATSLFIGSSVAIIVGVIISAVTGVLLYSFVFPDISILSDLNISPFHSRIAIAVCYYLIAFPLLCVLMASISLARNKRFHSAAFCLIGWILWASIGFASLTFALRYRVAIVNRFDHYCSLENRNRDFCQSYEEIDTAGLTR